MIRYKGKDIGNSRAIEYYDRELDQILLGTFVRLCDLPIGKGQLFLVPKPSDDDVRPTNGRAGHCEGRFPHKAYLLPVAMTCRAISNTHISYEKEGGGNGGAWIKDACWIELDSLEDFETIPD